MPANTIDGSDNQGSCRRPLQPVEMLAARPTVVGKQLCVDGMQRR